MSDLCDFDHDSTLDVPEDLGGGIVWWTRHTRVGRVYVLELPPCCWGAPAFELQLLGTLHGRTSWVWRTERGTFVRPVDGIEA